MAVEALQKKREAKYRLLMEEQVKARVLEQANQIRQQRIELAKKARKEARIAQLKRMQKELEIIEATKDKRSVVDLKIDEKPVGRLIVNRNKQYDFNLQTEIDKKKKPEGEVLVDLKIDGAKGPIPKIVNVRKPKGRTFIDTEKGIKQIQTKFTEDHNLAAAQIGAVPAS